MKKKRIILFSVTLLFLLSSLSLSFNTVDASSQKNQTTKAQNEARQKAKNRILFYVYKQSDQTIKEVIKKSSVDYKEFKEYLSSYNLDIQEDKMGIWQPEVNVITPSYLIAINSYIANSKYETYTLAEAKKLVSLFKDHNAVDFSIGALGDSIDFADGVSVVMRQNGKTIKPINISKSDLARDSKYWPKSPAYLNNITATFDLDELDCSKNAELVYMYSGKELSVTYKVDFSEIK